MKTKRGSILAYALVILTIMASISVVMTTSTMLEKKSSGATDFSTQAYQTADSGVQIAIKAINSNVTVDAELIDVFSDCNDTLGYATIKVDNLEMGGSTYELIFSYDHDNDSSTPVEALMCDDSIRKIEFIKSIGTYKSTTRAVEVLVGNYDPCEGEDKVYYEGGPHDDGDGLGSYYSTVAIGDQCWLGENLNVGEILFCPYPSCQNGCAGGTSEQNGGNGIIEKACRGSSEADRIANCTAEGGLYTHLEALQFASLPERECGLEIQGICPEGWHIPSATFRNSSGGDCDRDGEDFIYLNDYLGGLYFAGGRLKESGTSHWLSPNIVDGDSDRITDFNAVPTGGYAAYSCQLYPISLYEPTHTAFRTSGSNNSSNAIAYHLYNNSTDFINTSNNSDTGNLYPIRCVKNRH